MYRAQALHTAATFYRKRQKCNTAYDMRRLVFEIRSVTVSCARYQQMIKPWALRGYSRLSKRSSVTSRPAAMLCTTFPRTRLKARYPGTDRYHSCPSFCHDVFHSPRRDYASAILQESPPKRKLS